MIISQVRKCYKEFRFSWKLLTHLIGFVALIFCFVYAFNQFKTIQYFPIKEVKVAGIQHVDHAAVQRIITPLVNKGFFAVNVDQIKESLAQFPWVADASVRRVWPNQVIIQVAEKLPLARWNDEKLLSQSGELFSPARETFPTHLPQFVGPEGMQLSMMESYAQMDKVLAPLHFKITRLELSPAHAWSLTLENGIKINVGHKDILTRLGDFVKVYPKIVGSRANEVNSVDLRYSNGLAVRWKTII